MAPSSVIQTDEIRRERDDVLLNKLGNDPEVRPFLVYHDNHLDWSPALIRFSGVVILSNGLDAIGLFELTAQTEAGQEFQVHTMFGPTCRGQRAIETAKAMIAYLFAGNVSRIWGRTPLSNRRARIFNRLCGAKSIGFDDSFIEGPVEIFEMRR